MKSLDSLTEATRQVVIDRHVERSATAAESKHIDAGLQFDISLAGLIGGDVPPAAFGPLWPMGYGPQLPVESPEEPKLELTFTVPESMTEDEITELVFQAACRTSALHIAYGGSGLVIDDLKIFCDGSDLRESK